MPRGSFGRRRRQASNLTSLIMQLVAQQRAAEDRAIFDAYENGGFYKGKPVDDARLRSFIKQRRDSMGKSGKDDPLWDEWNNRLIQLDFKIGEEKIGLAFKQGKVGAGAVAAYYRSQLSKIPKESAFYRDVAGRAADWAKAAGSAARGRARGRATSALNGAFEANVKRQSDFLTLDAYVTEYAKRAGIIAGNETITDADATDIQALFAQNLPGPNGGTITMRDYQAASLDYYKALGQDIQLSAQAGRGVKTKTTARAKFLNQHLIRLNTVDDRSKYELAKESFEEAWNNAADPYSQLAAAQEYVKNLTGIRDGALTDEGYRRNDPEFIGGLNNEINAITTGKETGPTVADLQSSATESTPESDMKSLVESITNLSTNIDLLDSGRAVLGQTEPGGNLDVIPLGASSANDPFGRNGFDESMQASIQNIDGRKQVVWLKGEAVKSAVARDATTGEVIDPSIVPDFAAAVRSGSILLDEGPEGSVAGYVFTSTDGTRKYGVIDPASGKMMFSSQNPFSSDIYGGFVFGSSFEEVDDRVVPTGLTQPLSVTGAAGSITVDPFLTGSTVAPGDVAALAAAGDPRFGTTDPETIAAYQQRIQMQENERRNTLAARDLGLQDRAGIGQQSATTQGGGGDLRQGVLDAISAASALTRQSFAPNLSTTPTAPPSAPGFGSGPGVSPPGLNPAAAAAAMFGAAPKPPALAAAAAGLGAAPKPTGGAAAGALIGVGGGASNPGGGAAAGALLGVGTVAAPKPKPPKPTTVHEHL